MEQLFINELHRVMVHGVLHLLGYTDKNLRAKKIMTEKENYYLDQRPKELF
jgi:ssRNA-specific RNase YbeY (16S rRNA maturation enzyme)